MAAQLAVWSSDPMDFVKEVKDEIRKTAEQTILQIFEGVVQRTPVFTGNLRASWRITLPPSLDFDSYVVGGSEGAPLAAPSVPSSIPGLPDFPVIYLVNCTPYAGLVEDGGPKNAPHHMMALTLESVLR